MSESRHPETKCSNCGEYAVVAIWDLTCPHCGWGYTRSGEGYIFNPNTWEPGLELDEPEHLPIKKKIDEHRNGEGPPVRFSSTTVFCNFPPAGPGGSLNW